MTVTFNIYYTVLDNIPYQETIEGVYLVKVYSNEDGEFIVNHDLIPAGTVTETEYDITLKDWQGTFHRWNKNHVHVRYYKE